MNALKHGDGDYSYWHRALAGEKPPMHDGEPHCGFYRMSRKEGVDDVVSYFWHGSELACLVNGKPVQRGAEIWNYCGHQPVSHEDYLHRVEQGRWRNDAAVVVRSNNPPDDNSMEAVLARLEELEREAAEMMKAGAAADQAAADRASDVANSIAEIEKQIVSLHKAEKEPFLSGGRTVDGKWFPVRDRAITLKVDLKAKVVTPFLLKLRKDAEEEARRARELGVEQFLEQPKIGAGSMKRTVALRPKVSAKIVDYDALIMAVKNHHEVRDLVQRIADAAARGGNALPGSVRVETSSAV